MIGIFDSGVGGLSVLLELRKAMPWQSFLYLADTAHVPYGSRSEAEIAALTEACTAALVARGVAGVVVACNTASAFGLAKVRAQHNLPILGLVPALKPAVKQTKSGVVGVLATAATFRGALLQEVVTEWAEPAGVQVIKAAHPELVPLIEAGQRDGARMREVLREALHPMLMAGADQLVLGCTHYPFLKEVIRRDFPFQLVDSGRAVAQHAARVFGTGDETSNKRGELRFLLTGDPEQSRAVVAGLLKEHPDDLQLEHIDIDIRYQAPE